MYAFGIDIPLDVLFLFFCLLVLIEFFLLVKAGRKIKKRCQMQAEIEHEVQHVREQKLKHVAEKKDVLYPEVGKAEHEHDELETLSLDEDDLKVMK
jgi:hypothetical protein